MPINPMPHDVFISYASEDKAVAEAVCEALERKGIGCWIAPRNIPPAALYAKAIIDGIRGSRVLVLVFSARSNSSRHVARELERADDRGIPILPFRIEDLVPSDSLEYYLAGRQWLNARTPPSEADLAALADSVRVLLPEPRTERTASPTSSTAAAERPLPGGVQAEDQEIQAMDEVPAAPAPRLVLGRGLQRRSNSLGNTLIRIPPEFLPGGHQPDVNLYASATCVTNRDYLSFVKDGYPAPQWSPKYCQGRTWREEPRVTDRLDDPVVFVTHEQAILFCDWLTNKERTLSPSQGGIYTFERYTLPTLAQWRAVARSAHLTDDTVLDAQWVRPAKSGKPNSIGLYCLFGNVFEWCLDTAQKNIRRGRAVSLQGCWLAIGGGWASSRGWLAEQIGTRTYGGIWCPRGRPIKDGGFRLWLLSRPPGQAEE
jgi:hypothetical protein